MIINRKVVQTITRRELSSYFSTPIATIFLITFLVLSSYFTFQFGRFIQSNQATLRPFFMWHPWLFLFIIPALTMRLWAEEKKSGTIELLLSLPISPLEATLGKFFAAWIFMGLALFLTFPIVISVYYLGSPDTGVIITSYLGSFLMAGSYLALGIFVSSLCRNQIISFILATTLLFILTLLGSQTVLLTLSQFLPPEVIYYLEVSSFPHNFEGIQRGLIDLRNIFYYVSLIFLGLSASTYILERSK